MKKEGFTTIIIGHSRPDQPRGGWSRLLRAIGNLIGWLFAIVPGAFFVVLGFEGILNERMTTVGRLGTSEHIWTGDNAIGWGWFYVGIGLAAVGYLCYGKSGLPVFRICGWSSAAEAMILAVFYLTR